MNKTCLTENQNFKEREKMKVELERKRIEPCKEGEFYIVAERDGNIMHAAEFELKKIYVSWNTYDYKVIYWPSGIVVFPQVDEQVKANTLYLAKVVYTRKKNALKVVAPMLELTIDTKKSSYLSPDFILRVKEDNDLVSSGYKIKDKLWQDRWDFETKLNGIISEFKKVKYIDIYQNRRKIKELAKREVKRQGVQEEMEYMKECYYYAGDCREISYHNIDICTKPENSVKIECEESNITYLSGDKEYSFDAYDYMDEQIENGFYKLPEYNPIPIADMLDIEYDEDTHLDCIIDKINEYFLEMGKIDKNNYVMINEEQMQTLFYNKKEFAKGEYKIIFKFGIEDDYGTFESFSFNEVKEEQNNVLYARLWGIECLNGENIVICPVEEE